MIKLFALIVFLIQCESFSYAPRSINQERNNELICRVENDQYIRTYLNDLLFSYNADRVFIIQYHNGTKDWQHGTMRFEICTAYTNSIKNDYQNFNLTWIDLPFYLKEYNYFIGNINSLQKIDPVLYDQFNSYNVQNVAFVIITDDNEDPIGILGFTGTNLNINENLLLNESKIIYGYIK